ncbi:MAG: hypothetical protein GYB64_02070 [Chloroflexi bacterium]|nr:hypothetical protein [Chloroflexota bacterium]
MQKTTQPPAWGVIIGLVPALALITWDVVRTLRWPQLTVIPAGIVLLAGAAMLGVYAAISLRHRQVPVWLFAGLGLVILGMLAAIPFPGGVTGPVMVAAVVALAAAGRRAGPAGTLLVLPGMLMGFVSLLDPTYGWFLTYPEAQPAAALTQAAILSLPLIGIPLVVLTHKQAPAIWIAGLSLLTLEAAVFAGLVRAVGQTLLYVLTVNQLMVALLMVPVLALLWWHQWLPVQPTRQPAA